MIAHRVSTLEICDARLDLEHGRVVAMTPRRTPARRRPKHTPVPCDPVTHPVVGAWRTIAPAGSRVDHVDRLRARPKAQVYRLVLDDGATSVIAKHARSEALLLERTLYERVLPRLPIPALHYLGFVADDDEQSAWLFIEDAGDDKRSLGEHGPLAARWLGTLHGAAVGLDLAQSLPERSPGHYLEHLRTGRATILRSFDNPALREERSTLRELVSTCDLIESSWSGVEAICNDLPKTLVHGDFSARNLRLRRDEDGPAIVAFDWECSGFGVPAADVFKLALDASSRDLAGYRATASAYARGFGKDELQALMLTGVGFRLLASVDWAATHLPFARPERGIAYLQEYEHPLREWGAALAGAA